MKKSIAMLLAIVMVFSILPISVFATETGGTITFATNFDNNLGKGDVFTVTATLSDNPGIASFTNMLKWNNEVVKFTGFTRKTTGNKKPISEVFADDSITASDTTGGFAVALDYDNDISGLLYTANFEIIAEEGELGLGLTTTEFGKEFMFADVGGNDIMPALDFSAITGLTVGGKPVGPEMPEDAPFTAITTDAGAIVDVEDCGFLAVDPWGGNPVEVPYYHITIPAEATEAYIRFDQPISDFMSQTKQDGTPEIGSSWACVNDYGSGMAGLLFADMDDYTNVIIPLEFNGDPWGGEDMKSTVKTADEDELYYAVGPQDAGANTIAVFSLEFASEDGEEEEIYSITIDGDLVGGTLTASNEDGDPITEAAAGDYVFVTITPAEGYSGNSYTINGELANDVVFQMPEEDVILSATFTPIHTCSYTESVVDAKYLKENATCQSGAVYYKSCECGEFVTTAETFVSGDPVTHHYVGGKCEWCQLAEVIGYRFATSADVSANNEEEVTVHVKITGHSNPNITTYNAYDLTLTYDNTKLEFVSGEGADQGDQIKIEKKGDNTIQIVGVGDAKGFDVEVATLTFKTKAEGNANVTISKIQVSDKETATFDDVPEATPKHDEDDTGADETPDVSVIVVPYSVDKPGFISGENKVLHGETYTFSYTDTTNYTYADLTVKVGGTEVETLIPDENGVYTIAGVTGAIKITATQTANSYDVIFNEENTAKVEGSNKATYGENYIFTVTPSTEDMAIESVTITDAQGNEIKYTINENGEYVIKGTDITGKFTITVTEKKDMTTIKFDGIEETEIEGGKLIVAAKIGETFSFKLIKDEKFDYIAKIGDTELTVDEMGNYIIPAELVGENEVIVKIEKVDNTKATIDVKEYISLDGKVMFLVTAKWRDKVLAYGEDTMYYSDKYTVTGEEEAGAYCWLVVSTGEMNTVELVKAAAEADIKEAAEGTTATAVKYNYDINGTTIVDVNDAQLAYDMYNASYMEFTDTLPMWKFLKADMEIDGKLDTKDVAAIISYIVSGANA